MYELDHVYVWTEPGAPEARSLITRGFREGSPNVHHGQGTANRRFFFRNAMLELLWVSDARQARTDAIRPLHLWERWTSRRSGGCPFGVCFRSAAENVPSPFPAWDYHPPYASDARPLAVATNAGEISEPMLFFIAGLSRQDARAHLAGEPFDHPRGVKEVTRVRLAIPAERAWSPAMQSVLDARLLAVDSDDSGISGRGASNEYLLEVVFDAGLRERLDLRPELPLVFRR